MSFPVALVLVALSGFIALSYELLWYRAYSFVSEGGPAAFGALLGAYLLGIAVGSFASRWFCKDRAAAFDPKHLRSLAAFVFGSSLLGLLVVPVMARFVTISGSAASTLPFVGVSAGLQGAILPLISHFGIAPDDKAGARLSYLYMSNILGSATGSLLTGFVLMDSLTMRGISVFLFVCGSAVTLGLLLLGRKGATGRGSLFAMAGVAALAALSPLLAGPLFHDVYERLLRKKTYKPGDSFAFVVENKSGVISVSKGGTIYGGGIYDGVFSTDLVHDRNLVVRAYALSALHPKPRDVLIVGLASGSWAQVVANHPDVESVTIIEINPGYLEIIPRYPEVASLLKNPKVKVIIDDGRRWLSRNPDRKFDFVLQNTTWHFRAHATNLLSTEYLRLTGDHLNPGGVVFFNTTKSRDAQLTAAKTFPYALRFMSFMAASDSPISVDKERWRRVLSAYRIDGKPVFDPASDVAKARLEEVVSLLDPREAQTEEDLLAEWRRNLVACQDQGKPCFDLTQESERKRLDMVLRGAPDRVLAMPSMHKPEIPLEDRDSILARSPGAVVITDDNMINEWRKIPAH